MDPRTAYHLIKQALEFFTNCSVKGTGRRVVCLSLCASTLHRLFCFCAMSLLVFCCNPLFCFYDFNVKGESENGCDASHLVQFCNLMSVDGRRREGGERGIGYPLEWHSRCPDSCMLEKIKTFAPWDRTDSTSLTYFLRNAGSFDLSREYSLSVLILGAAIIDSLKHFVGDKKSIDITPFYSCFNVF